MLAKKLETCTGYYAFALKCIPQKQNKCNSDIFLLKMALEYEEPT